MTNHLADIGWPSDDRKDSVASFEFLGYTPAKAAQLHQILMNMESRFRHEDSVLEIACASVDEKPWDAVDMSDNWAHPLRTFVVNEQLSDTIKDPEFNDMIMAESASY